MPNWLDHTLLFKPVTVLKLLHIGKNLKGGTSCGIDGISPNVVKYTLPYIVEPFLYICNVSLQTGHVPSKLKISKVIPVFKKDDPSDFSSYRPISTVSCHVSPR